VVVEVSAALRCLRVQVVRAAAVLGAKTLTQRMAPTVLAAAVVVLVVRMAARSKAATAATVL
jgi:hypothetical protein